jgi:hypothetical protein
MAEPTTAPTRPLKAVAYVRVSTDRQSEEGFGLIIQREKSAAAPTSPGTAWSLSTPTKA